MVESATVPLSRSRLSPQDLRRETVRSAETLRLLGYALGGEAGARLAERLGIRTSADTMLRRLKTERAAVGAVQAVGVDEWAWRKGRRYGTILLDLEKRAVVGLLAERSAASFREWLERHPKSRSSVEIAPASTGRPAVKALPKPCK